RVPASFRVFLVSLQVQPASPAVSLLVSPPAFFQNNATRRLPVLSSFSGHCPAWIPADPAVPPELICHSTIFLHSGELHRGKNTYLRQIPLFSPSGSGEIQAPERTHPLQNPVFLFLPQ